MATSKVKTLSIKRLYKMRDEWIEQERLKLNLPERKKYDETINHFAVTSFIEYVNEHRND